MTSPKTSWRFRSIIAVLAAAVLLVGCSTTHSTSAVTQERGALSQEIIRLTSLVFPENSGLYVPPNAQQRADFRALAASVMNGDYEKAAEQAKALGYELVDFHDTETSRHYYILRERLNAHGRQKLGWGTYIWNPEQKVDALIEAPHPLFDPRTPELAMAVFQKVGARGFLMSGAHRSQDGSIYGIADPARNAAMIFQAVHETWSGPATLPVEIHGFDIKKHPELPKDTNVVISNGDGTIPPVHLKLCQAFNAEGMKAHIFNTLPADDPLNAQANGKLPGSTFHMLGATQNVQGQYSRSTYHVPFIHCETSLDVRVNDPAKWKAAIEAISKTIIEWQTNPTK